MGFLSFLTTSWFVAIYCVVIILAPFALSVWKLTGKARPLKNKLRQATEMVDRLGEKDFAQKFKDINESWKKQFGTPWKEFVETLVVSPDEIKNSHEVSRRLNESAIIFPELSLDFYRAVPNLLTGVGILGTFVGLAAGVGLAQSGLSPGASPQEITESLGDLLGGASLAFVTSICGIGASLAFVFIERRESRALRLEVDEWAQAVESCLKRVAHEEVALQQLDVARCQHDVARDQLDVARDQLDVARDQLKQLERFNTDLVFTLEQALEGKVTGRLAPLLTQLVQSVEGLRADRSSDAGKMIEKVLREFTEAMQGHTGEHFEGLGAVVGNLNLALENHSQEMAKSQSNMRAAMERATDSAASTMSAAAGTMTETLAHSLDDVTRRLSDASQKVADDIAEAGAAATRQVGKSLEALGAAAAELTRSTEHSRVVLDEMTAFAAQVRELRATIATVRTGFADIAEPILTATREASQSSARVADALMGTVDLVERVSGLVEAMERQQQAIADSWKRHLARFEGVDDSLERVFRELDAGLSGYCEQVKAFANELDKTTSSTIRDLAGATSELGQSIEDLMDYLSRRTE